MARKASSIHQNYRSEKYQENYELKNPNKTYSQKLLLIEINNIAPKGTLDMMRTIPYMLAGLGQGHRA